MALSRRDVILASFAAFVGWSSIIFWIPSLGLLPFAYAAGILTALIASLCIVLTTSRGMRHTTSTADPRTSFVSFTQPTSWHNEVLALEERLAYHPQPIYSTSLAISKQIDSVLGLALRDFVKSWYSKISPGHAFSNEVDSAVRTSLNTILERVFEIDLVQFGVTRLLPIINNHVKNFREAERQVRGKNLNLEVTETAELDIAIAGRYRDGRLHPAASLAASKTTALQQQHLRRIAGSVVAEVLPSYMTSSSSVMILIREILACAVFLPLMVLIADPDVLNQLIGTYGRSLSQERKTVRRLRAALDEASNSQNNSLKPSAFVKLTPGAGERNFEKFVRSIRLCTSLSDARRFRSEISRQIKKDGANPDCDLTYLRRLEIGRKLLDQKITELSTQQAVRPTHSRQESRSSETESWSRESATLHQILYDASALSYFMEFMDRLRLMSLVQFWIVVDGMRTPLESTDDDIDNSGSWNQSDRQDLTEISAAYLHRSELKVTQATKDTVQAFLDAGEAATNTQFKRARQAILDVQANIFQEMKSRHFPKFRQSDLFYKWLASENTQQSISTTNKSMNSHISDNISRESSKEPIVNVLKESELRRAIASSSDLPSLPRKLDEDDGARKSFDDSVSRRPLFEDEFDDEPLSRSTPTIRTDTASPQPNQERNAAIDAVQAALDNLIDENGESESLTTSWMATEGIDSPRPSLDGYPPMASTPTNDKGKPSLSSLGLVGTPSRPTVFSQGDLFGENEKLWEDGDEKDDTKGKTDDDIHEAAPGDLGLTEVVETMTVDIERLDAQKAIVDSLTKKAELTNNTAELRILRKSRTSLEREIRHKELQRQQYIVQKSENDLYGRASISITSIMVGTEADGHEYALYVIEVQRHAGENAPAVTWAIARRYSEFHDLHRRLRSKFPEIKDLDFPRRQVVVTLQRDFLKKRRVALEKYLRELLSKSAVCRSIEFRAFLSQQTIRPTTQPDGNQIDKQDFITRIYNSVTDGMEEFLGNVPVLDQLSAAGQSLISAATSVPSSGQLGATQTLAATSSNPLEAAEAEAEMAAFETARDPEKVTFIKPICDAFVEIFQLNQGNNWLRGRAVVVVIQQLLGGTIERRVRETYRGLTSEDSILRYIELLKETMWPGGSLRTTPPLRTEAEKAKSRREAGLVLATLLPDLAGGVVGRGSAAEAGRRIFATLNNERLNQHLLYTILDEIVDVVFGIRVSPGKLA